MVMIISMICRLLLESSLWHNLVIRIHNFLLSRNILIIQIVLMIIRLPLELSSNFQVSFVPFHLILLELTWYICITISRVSNELSSIDFQSSVLLHQLSFFNRMIVIIAMICGFLLESSIRHYFIIFIDYLLLSWYIFIIQIILMIVRLSLKLSSDF